MTELSIKPASATRFDLVSLGEVMLRLDPGDDRIHTTRGFRPGKGEASTTSRAVCAAVSACGRRS